MTEEKKYKVEIPKKVLKNVKSFPVKDQHKIDKAIENLETNPRPQGCEKLKARECAYRVRVGNYRIVYDIYDHRLLILIIDIGDRKEVYKKR